MCGHNTTTCTKCLLASNVLLLICHVLYDVASNERIIRLTYISMYIEPDSCKTIKWQMEYDMYAIKLYSIICSTCYFHFACTSLTFAHTFISKFYWLIFFFVRRSSKCRLLTSLFREHTHIYFIHHFFLSFGASLGIFKLYWIILFLSDEISLSFCFFRGSVQPVAQQGFVFFAKFDLFTANAIKNWNDPSRR